jgi:ABC-2 type transport system permease protein
MSAFTVSFRKEAACLGEGVSVPISVAAFALFQAVWLYFPEGFFAVGKADLKPLFSAMPVALAFLAAALSLRSWTEEERQGTLDLVFGMPGSLAVPVLAKFAAQACILVVALAATLPVVLGASLLGRFDAGLIFSNYLGALLSGCAALAIGQAWSARAAQQGGAFLGTVLTCLAFFLADRFSDFTGLDGFIADFFNALSLGRHGRSFMRGLLDGRDLLWFLAFQAFFLALAVQGLERKRWRS